jgi:hypothetical protein
MSELVFLLEEPSAKAMLESLLPRMLNAGVTFDVFHLKANRISKNS